MSSLSFGEHTPSTYSPHERNTPMDIRKSLGLEATDDGTDFPVATPKAEITFALGDTVIVTTACEDITLQGLTGTVVPRQSSIPSRAYDVKMDVDDIIMPFLPHEIGHHF